MSVLPDDVSVRDVHGARSGDPRVGLYKRAAPRPGNLVPVPNGDRLHPRQERGVRAWSLVHKVKDERTLTVRHDRTRRVPHVRRDRGPGAPDGDAEGPLCESSLDSASAADGTPSSGVLPTFSSWRARSVRSARCHRPRSRHALQPPPTHKLVPGSGGPTSDQTYASIAHAGPQRSGPRSSAPLD